MDKVIKGQITKSPIWEGDGLVDVDGGSLTCAFARLVLTGVRSGDTVELTSESGVHEYRILQVPNDDQLQYDGEAKAGAYKVRILREISDPCLVCKKRGDIRESDHIHCNHCKSDVDANMEGRVNCLSCVLKMRKRLAQEPRIVTKMKLFGGKKTVAVHARTVAEGDQIQEFQDRLVKDHPEMTVNFVLEESRKAAVAMSVDDDGNGGNPREMVIKPEEVSPADQVSLMIKHFKGMTAPYYQTVMSAVAMHDSLIEDACRDRIKDDISEDDILQLSEDLALSAQPEGRVNVWGGEMVLTFVAPTTDDIDDANAFAENFIRSSKEAILDGRAKFIMALARLAAYFRGDNKKKFTGSETFDERIAYLLELPLVLFYVYQDASLVWQRRMARASEVEVLGNF